MKTVFKTPLVLSAALIAPLFYAGTANATTTANSAPLVNQQAVEQLTTGLKDTLAAYDALNTGSVTTARAKLDTALRKMESALSKDATLGIAQTSAKALHSDLKSVRTKMNSGDQMQVKSELSSVLSKAGVAFTS